MKSHFIKTLMCKQSSKTVFSAGLDILEMYNPEPERCKAFWTTLQDVWLKLYGSPYPTAAAINVRIVTLRMLSSLHITKSRKKFDVENQKYCREFLTFILFTTTALRVFIAHLSWLVSGKCGQSLPPRATIKGKSRSVWKISITCLIADVLDDT